LVNNSAAAREDEAVFDRVIRVLTELPPRPSWMPPRRPVTHRRPLRRRHAVRPGGLRTRRTRLDAGPRPTPARYWHLPAIASVSLAVACGMMVTAVSGAPGRAADLAASMPQPGGAAVPAGIDEPAGPGPIGAVVGGAGPAAVLGVPPVVGAPPADVPAAALTVAADPVPVPTTDLLPDDRARIAIATAMAQLGLPYVWGGDGPANGDAGFDCSGLTTFAYRAAGITLPRTAHTQYYAGPRVPAGAPLHPGDLVFYGTPRFVHHVGMYVGRGRMINAPRFGQPVQVAYYRWPGDDYLGANRPAASGTPGLLPVPAAPAPQPPATRPDVFRAPPAVLPSGPLPAPADPAPPEADSAAAAIAAEAATTPTSTAPTPTPVSTAATSTGTAVPTTVPPSVTTPGTSTTTVPPTTALSTTVPSTVLPTSAPPTTPATTAVPPTTTGTVATTPSGPAPTSPAATTTGVAPTTGRSTGPATTTSTRAPGTVTVSGRSWTLRAGGPGVDGLPTAVGLWAHDGRPVVRLPAAAVAAASGTVLTLTDGDGTDDRFQAARRSVVSTAEATRRIDSAPAGRLLLLAPAGPGQWSVLPADPIA
jgi:cell wall-associated NlpC family hydrolase